MLLEDRLFYYIVSRFFIFLSVTYTGVGHTSNCDITDITTKIRTEIGEIRDYQLDSSVVMDGKLVTSNIKGMTPRFMRIHMDIAGTNPAITISAIFDGEYQWIESKYPGGVEVSKIELARVTSKERPFDTSYYIMGSGLVNGESYPGSVLTLLSVYDVKPTCHQGRIELSGPLNVDKFTQYLKSKQFPKSVEFKVNKYKENFGFSHFVFSEDNRALMRYSLGRKRKPDFFSVHFENIKFNQGLKPEDFKYVPPAGADVTDITDALLESLEGGS